MKGNSLCHRGSDRCGSTDASVRGNESVQSLRNSTCIRKKMQGGSCCRPPTGKGRTWVLGWGESEQPPPGVTAASRDTPK